MKVLLTGGAGYVGSACLRHLLREGHDPIAYDDLSTGNVAAVPEQRLIVGDILDQRHLRTVLEQHGIEAVMHFAAVASVPESLTQPSLYWRVNVLGTKCVLDAMVDCGVRRLVFSSTAATYGFRAEMPLVEDACQAPQVPYGTSKLAAEWLIADYSRAYGLGYACLRYFNASGADADGHYGEDRRDESHIIPRILRTALGIQDWFLIFGADWDTRDGTCVRDYVHTDDLAQAHRRAIETMTPGHGRAYNLGTGHGVTVMEVLRACEAVVGRPIPFKVVERRAGDPAVLVASADRIKHELGWTPQYREIGAIVETAWRWHSTHPDGYGARQTSPGVP